MVDKILEYVPGKSAHGQRAVSSNEWFFIGHFEKTKVMPGVLMIEAMAQTGAIALMTMDEMIGKLAYLARIEKAKFSKIVKPGDLLDITVTIEAIKYGIGFGSGTVMVENEVAATGRLVFAIGEEEK